MSVKQEFDVAIVGGGPAGLSAALILGRAVRSVVVFDQGNPRNAPARESHNVFSRDGIPPGELLAIAQQQLQPYDVTFEKTKVSDIQKLNYGFKLVSDSDLQVTARKVILCTGLADVMPNIPGVEQFWGKTVIHCPYCHGWEFRNKPIAALVNTHSILNFAALLSGWTNNLTLLSNGPVDIEPDVREKIDAHGFDIIEDRIKGFKGSNGMLEKVIFKNENAISKEAVFIDPPQKFRSGLYKKLNLKYEEDGELKTNRFGETSIPGIYVAGDAGPHMQQITIAAASGAEVAIGINHKLLDEDF